MNAPMRRLLFAIACSITPLLPTARAASADIPELTMGDGSGTPGSTVSVVIRLSGDVGSTGVTADLDIRMPTDLVDFQLPVTANCAVAERLATTHQIGGTIHEPGVLTLALFARQLVIAPLDDGDLATCDFHILAGAEHGTAALTIEFAGLGSARGVELPVVGVDGAIAIGDDTATARCAGDCDGNGIITVDELVRGIQIVLGKLPVTACGPMDTSGTGTVSVSEMVNAVSHGLGGCEAAR